MATLTTDHPLLAEDVPSFLEPAGGSRRQGSATLNNLDWRQAAGVLLLALGAIVLLLGWYGVSGTTNVAQQLSYFISGGLGGAGMVAAGLALVISYEHVADRRTLSRLEERLDRLELALASEFDTLRDDLRTDSSRNGSGTGKRSRTPS